MAFSQKPRTPFAWDYLAGTMPPNYATRGSALLGGLAASAARPALGLVVRNQIALDEAGSGGATS